MKKKISLLLAILMLVTLIPTAFAESKTVEAVKNTKKVTLDGEEVMVGAYDVEGYNYLKLRDVAAILNGKKCQFDVGYDKPTKLITVELAKGYEKVEGDLAEIKDEKAKANIRVIKILVNGEEKEVKTALINENNYMQLRDLGSLVGLGVGYDKVNKVIMLKSDAEEKPEEDKKDEKIEDKEEEKFSENDNAVFSLLTGHINATINRYKDYNIIPFTDDENQNIVIGQINLSILYGQRLYTDGAKIEKSIEMRDGVKTYVVKYTYPSGAENKMEAFVNENGELSATDRFVVGPIIGFIDKEKNIDKMSKEDLLAKFTKAHDAIADGDYKKACEVLRELNYEADEAKLEKLVKIKKEDAKNIGAEIFLKDYEASIEAEPFGDGEYIFVFFKYKDGSALRFDIQHENVLGLALLPVILK